MLISSACILTSCNSTDEQKGKDLAYFDVKSFVANEIAILDAKDPEVVKTMYADNKKETRVSRGIRWVKELELFMQADINKPAYRLSYVVKQPDELHLNYTLKRGERLPVQSLKITLDSLSRMPSLIEASLLSKNKLYHSEKEIKLECKQVGSSWMVHSYQVSGYQKLSLMDARNFKIIGVLKI
jgi:hypothetical protein